MQPKKFKLAKWLLQRVVIGVGALSTTTAFFLVLPLIQTISEAPTTDTLVREMETADVPPPPAPPEEEPEEEPEPEEQPPELQDESQPLDLSQLEFALNPGFSDGWMAGDFVVKLSNVAGGGKDVDALFALSDLDTEPRAIHQPSPVVSAAVRKRAPGTVYVLFVVDQQGRVVDPIVQKSTDPVFDAPALAAVKQWKFEPGKREGQPVSTRMRVPITFPKG